ncbi:MAG: Beta-galactosidase trimerization domain protein [Lentisphaerae bacterium ADurb.Bin242]|nr:MAG: Beta-galactosidase trimerization domain protein [Lentisphaerae bacterium ADurb.Bin242]
MIMFYTSMGEPPSYFGILRPDLSLYTPAGILLQQTRKLREGLGTALMSSTTVNDPVAIYYSYPSSFGARILNGPSYDFARNNHDGAINLVISLGLSFEYVTNARIESGETSLAKYKVLLLPNASAVSDKNAGEINEFVRNGGTVIADIRAGIFTDVLNVRKPGAFDNAAGISRNGIQAALKTSLTIPGREDMKLLLEPGVQTSGGKALFVSPEKVPAVIVHPYGKGTFVTLNFSFHELPAFSPEGSELQSKIISFFDKVPPHAKVADGNGKPVFRLRRAEWKNGDMTILAFKSRPGPAMKCKAALPSARHVFNLNTEKALGKVQTFEFENTPPMPSFFVLSDSALPEIALQSPASARRGETVQVTYHVPQMKGKRPFLLSLEKDRNVYGRKLELCADTLPGKASFRIALNDPAGAYRFVLKDVFTGAVRELPLEVQ